MNDETGIRGGKNSIIMMKKWTSPPTPKIHRSWFKPSIKRTCKLGTRRPYGTLHLGQSAGTDVTSLKSIIAPFYSQTDRQRLLISAVDVQGSPYYGDCISMLKCLEQPERYTDGPCAQTRSASCCHIFLGRQSSSADAECLQKYLCLLEDLKRCETGIMMWQQRPLMEEKKSFIPQK